MKLQYLNNTTNTNNGFDLVLANNQVEIDKLIKHKIFNNELFEIKNNKILKASLLLSNSHYNIKEVAFSSGFNSPNYFTRCFKKITGLTPLKYRKKIVKLTSGKYVEDVSNTFIYKAKCLINKNLLNDSYKTDNLAFDLNVSRITLYRRIKSLTKGSIIEFIISERINSGAKLLKTNRYMVSEVAYMVGFSDPKYFCKCFKMKFGLTPLVYKALSKN